MYDSDLSQADGNMLCENCLKFFNQPWTKKFAKRSKYRERGRSLAVQDDDLTRQSACDICIFVASCSKSSYTANPRNDLLRGGGRQYKLCILPHVVRHQLDMYTLNNDGDGTLLMLDLSRLSGRSI